MELNTQSSPEEIAAAAAAANPELDPLSGAASGWEAPVFPLLMPDRICRFKISKCSVAPTKEDANRSALTIVMKTEKDYTGNDGKPLRSGFTCYKRIGVTPSEGSEEKRPRTWKNIGEDLGMVLKATGKLDQSPRDLLNNPSMVEGEVIDCRVGISKGTNNFPDSNTFTIVLPA